MTGPYLILLGGAFLLALLAIPPIKRLAWRLDLVDHPRDGVHKSHLRPIPYGGGIAIWAATLITSLLSPFFIPRSLAPVPFPIVLHPALVLLACATLLFLTGLVDDWRGLPPLPRFLIQLATTTTLVVACPEFRLLLFGKAPSVAVPLTVLWITALTNAFNFLDNMDGLSAGIGLVALLMLAGMGLLAHHFLCIVLCLILAGAIAGFLIFNFPPASIFMGDAGGFFIGFLISSTSVLSSHWFGQVFADLPHQLAPLLVLTVPLYDLITVSIIRLKNGVPPWIGDNNHISHRLVDLGLSRRTAVLVIYAATLLTCLPALLASWTSAATAWILLLLIPLTALVVASFDVAARRRGGRSA